MKPCLHEGCDRLSHARHLCSKHYVYYRQKGLPLPAAEKHGTLPVPKSHPVYTAWANMKQRCRGNADDAPYYFDRKIGYCQDWETFLGFYRDMFPSWRQGLMLDRIDNNGNYEKSNCRWVTPTESSRNRRSVYMTEESARLVRRLYERRLPLKYIAEQVGCTLSNVKNILYTKTWSGTKNENPVNRPGKPVIFATPASNPSRS